MQIGALLIAERRRQGGRSWLGLLPRAGERCMMVAEQVGGVAVLIDAKDDRAAHWYESYGAVRLDDAPRSLMLPFAAVLDALRQSC